MRSPIRAPTVIIQHKRKKNPQIKSLPLPIFMSHCFSSTPHQKLSRPSTYKLSINSAGHLLALLTVFAQVEMFAPLCMSVLPSLQLLSRGNLYAGAFQVVSWEYSYCSFQLIYKSLPPQVLWQLATSEQAFTHILVSTQAYQIPEIRGCNPPLLLQTFAWSPYMSPARRIQNLISLESKLARPQYRSTCHTCSWPHLMEVIIALLYFQQIL